MIKDVFEPPAGNTPDQVAGDRPDCGGVFASNSCSHLLPSQPRHERLGGELMLLAVILGVGRVDAHRSASGVGDETGLEWQSGRRAIAFEVC